MSPPEKPEGSVGETKRGADAEATEPAAGNDTGPRPSSSEKKRKRNPMEPQTRAAPPLTETSLDPPRLGASGVARLAAARERCELRPKQFFVAWSGVLTLAWRGFPPEIEALKRDIASAFPALKPENPGSRWAKTTLGCLRDIERLTPDTLETLGNICDAFRDELCGTDGGDDACVPVDALSVVTYECRSLERVVSERVVRLRDAGTSEPAPKASSVRADEVADERTDRTETDSRVSRDVANLSRAASDGGVSEKIRRAGRRVDPPSAAELAVVDSVVAQFSDPARDTKRYFRDAARDGSRESHYRAATFGVTLVARVGGLLPSAVERFRDRVDDALPGHFAWFDEESLHCTVRGLVD